MHERDIKYDGTSRVAINKKAAIVTSKGDNYDYKFSNHLPMSREPFPTYMYNGRNPKYDLTNKRFGNLLVVGSSNEQNSNRSRVWVCRCDCGYYVKIAAPSLKKGKLTKCPRCIYGDKPEMYKGIKPKLGPKHSWMKYSHIDITIDEFKEQIVNIAKNARGTDENIFYTDDVKLLGVFLGRERRFIKILYPLIKYNNEM